MVLFSSLSLVLDLQLGLFRWLFELFTFPSSCLALQSSGSQQSNLISYRKAGVFHLCKSQSSKRNKVLLYLRIVLLGSVSVYFYFKASRCCFSYWLNKEWLYENNWSCADVKKGHMIRVSLHLYSETAVMHSAKHGQTLVFWMPESASLLLKIEFHLWSWVRLGNK